MDSFRSKWGINQCICETDYDGCLQIFVWLMKDCKPAGSDMYTYIYVHHLFYSSFTYPLIFN